MTDEDASKLREMAIYHLHLHLYDNPNTRPFGQELAANADQWKSGFNEEGHYYWVAPATADGRMLPGPLNVLRWDWHDFQAIKNYKPARKPGGNYQKADRCVAGEPPFTYTIGIQQIPAGPTYPECFGIFDKDKKIVAYLTEKQVREALEKFDAIATGEAGA